MKNLLIKQVFNSGSFLPNSSKFLYLKRIALFLILVLAGFNNSYSQTTVFTDNFESGAGKWTLTGTWELVTTKSNSATHSLTTANSSGTYLANQNISATMTTGANLTTYLGAEIDFYCQYALEACYDYVYLEISTDNGTTWFQIDSFNGTLSAWTLYKYDIGGFVGNASVKARFRLTSDQYIQSAGIYIDDFVIKGLTTDNSAPFITFPSPQFYQGVAGNNTVVTQIFEASGVQSSSLYYKVGATGPFTVSPSTIVGKNYTFIIPSQAAGSLVYYKIGATDNSPAHNISDTSKAQANYYISGTYLNYDNANIDGVSQFTSSGTTGAAVEMSAPSGGKITMINALIRNFTDASYPNNQMLFHVWADDGTGKPGTDLITPFLVTPAATLTDPTIMTVVDLRPYASQLTNLSGNLFVGFTVPSGTVNIVNSSAATGKRSFSYNGTAWSAVTTLDYEFRSIIIDNGVLPVELTAFTAKSVNSDVQLNWNTATEINNNGFDVEKKLNDCWQKIGFVPGHGNCNSPQNYSFIDNNVINGASFQYRLKQVDNDGNFNYSKSIEISIAPSDFGLSQNYPNPFNPATSIRYSISKKSFVKLAVYDILGREVASLVQGIKDQGTYNVEFNGSNLPSGVFIYRLEINPNDGSNSFLAVKKLMLLK
jgi:hypothetical protein